MKILLAVSVAVVSGLSGCVYDGCTLVPKQSSISTSPTSGCLSLSVEPTACVLGLQIVGTNNCTESLTITLPAQSDGGSAPLTFAPGAAISFAVDEATASTVDGMLRWSMPAQLGTGEVLVTVIGQPAP